MAFKLKPSSLTWAIIFFFKQYRLNNLVKLLVNACHVIFDASNNPTVTCFGF
jgi:hypothetical protein